jgi:hypothetical protein
VPGADVVRVGFPINAVASAVLAVSLVGAVFMGHRVAGAIVAMSALFESGSLAALVWTRRATVFGWTESGWSRGAVQTRSAEIAALVVLAVAAAAVAADGRTRAGAGVDMGSSAP